MQVARLHGVVKVRGRGKVAGQDLREQLELGLALLVLLEPVDNLVDLLDAARPLLAPLDVVCAVVGEAQVVRAVGGVVEVHVPDEELLGVAVEVDADGAPGLDLAVHAADGVPREDGHVLGLPDVPAQGLGQPAPVLEVALLQGDHVDVLRGQERDLLGVVVDDVAAAQPEVERQDPDVPDQRPFLGGHRHGHRQHGGVVVGAGGSDREPAEPGALGLALYDAPGRDVHPVCVAGGNHRVRQVAVLDVGEKPADVGTEGVPHARVVGGEGFGYESHGSIAGNVHVDWVGQLLVAFLG